MRRYATGSGKIPRQLDCLRTRPETGAGKEAAALFPASALEKLERGSAPNWITRKSVNTTTPIVLKSAHPGTRLTPRRIYFSM